MKHVLLVSWTLLFSRMGGLLAHPIADSSEMRYTEPVLAEDRAALSLGEYSFSDQTPPSGTGQGLPPLLAEELNSDGPRSAGFIPVGSIKEGMLEKAGSLHPFRRFLGSRKPFEKRGNPAECFWKYCV